MDLSNNYIIMSAAPDIQEKIPLSEIDLGDYVAMGKRDEDNDIYSTTEFVVGRLSYINMDDNEEYEFETHYPIVEDIKLCRSIDYTFVRLFTVDVLSELIMIYKDYSLYKLIMEFNYFYQQEIVCEDLSCVFDTLEKCWLAYYMQEVYMKRWDGSKWVVSRG